MAHSKLLKSHTGEAADAQANQVANILSALGLKNVDSLASISYFVARAQKTGVIGEADLNRDQNGFLANVFLPIAGLMSLKSDLGSDPDSFREWTFRTDDDCQQIVIPSLGDEHAICLEWKRQDSSTTPSVKIDFDNKVNTISIPHIDYDSQGSEIPLHTRWRHHILQVLMGTGYYPHCVNQDREKVGEPIEQASSVQELATAAGVNAINLGLPQFSP